MKEYNKEIKKMKLELVFYSENPEKIRQKDSLLELMDMNQKGQRKIGERLKVGIPCCGHYNIAFGDNFVKEE